VADVFLSYAEEDADVADHIEAAFRLAGIVIAPAHSAQQPAGIKAVSRELTSAKCVIVLWSDQSVQNELVLAEADYARGRDTLVSAVIGKPALPLGYRDVWFANLTGWAGDPDSDTFLILRRLVEARLRSQPQPARGAPPAHGNATPPQDPTVFLCYRREDTQDAAGRLHDRLVDTYGHDRVFMDIDSVPLGVDFVEHVSGQISRCSAVIVMIGKQWLRAKDKGRRRRLDNEDDLVRTEVAAALQQGIPVIPVFVQDAEMPRSDELPENIRSLSRRNGISLSATRWRTDVERLIKELDRVMKPSSGSSETPDSPVLHRGEWPSRRGGASASQHERSRVFICYRRSDSIEAATRLYDSLAGVYEAGAVFMETAGQLPPDATNPENALLSRCRAVLVVIGTRWLSAADHVGNRKLDNPSDHVRREIAAAIRHRVSIIPVLVQDAQLPTADELPHDIRALTGRTGISLSATHWKSDVERLVQALDVVMKPSADPESR
jgi:hypothetical protein